MVDLSGTVGTPPKMDTSTTFFGIEGRKLGIIGTFALAGVMLGLALENLIIAVPFLILGAIFGFYRKKGMPFWLYFLRKINYTLFNERFLEGEDKTCNVLMNINDIMPNYYKVGRNKYVALISVEGVSYNELTDNQERQVVGGFFNFLNASSFNFPIQIIAKKGRLPIHRVHPAPALNNPDVTYDKPLEHIGKNLVNHLDYIYDEQLAYYYYIAIPYICRDEGSSQQIRQRIEHNLDKRVGVVSHHLQAMNIPHARLSGDVLIRTLRAFVNEEKVIEERMS